MPKSHPPLLGWTKEVNIQLLTSEVKDRLIGKSLRLNVSTSLLIAEKNRKKILESPFGHREN